MLRTKKYRSALVGAGAAGLALAGLGAYLLWPPPTLDPADLDSALPAPDELPGFIPYDGLTGSLSVPPDNDEGRSVLVDAALEEQCGTWREEGDVWACQDVHAVGMVVLEQSENVFFRVLSNVLAYDDEDAAEAARNGLVADLRRTTAEAQEIREGSFDLGDAGTVFTAPDLTVAAVRVETVVVEAIVWDGSGQVSEEDERDMAERWPNLQVAKIEELLGRNLTV